MSPRTALAALLTIASMPALAQGTGYAGGTAGLTASGVPPNPFASNYPSAPPPRAITERRERRSQHRAVGAHALVPPGRIPR